MSEHHRDVPSDAMIATYTDSAAASNGGLPSPDRPWLLPLAGCGQVLLEYGPVDVDDPAAPAGYTTIMAWVTNLAEVTDVEPAWSTRWQVDQVVAAQRWAAQLVADHTTDLVVTGWDRVDLAGRTHGPRWVAHLAMRVHRLQVITDSFIKDYDLTPGQASRALRQLSRRRGVLVFNEPVAPGAAAVAVVHRRHIPAHQAQIEEVVVDVPLSAQEVVEHLDQLVAGPPV